MGTFSGLNLGAGSSSNTLIGYNAGSNVGVSSSNTAVGAGALGNGFQLIGSNNYNVAVGFNSLQYVSSTGVQNIGIGAYSGQSITVGSSNIMIGNYTQPSSNTGSNEIVIGNGTQMSALSGKGNNTAYIASPSGLYFYSPGTCYLQSTAISASGIQWAFKTDIQQMMGYNQGFSLLNSNTQIIPPVNGLYEITFSGCFVANGSTGTISFSNVSVGQYNVFKQTTINGSTYQANWTVQARPNMFMGGIFTGFQVISTNMTLDINTFMYLSIKFLSL